MPTDGNFHTKIITFLCQAMWPAHYLEIGCYHSDTIRLIKQICGDSIHVAAVDIKEPRIKLQGVDYYIMSSQEFLTRTLPYLGWSPSFAFIDADHRFESVRADFLALLPSMLPGSLIFLHDTWPADQAQTQPGYSGDCHRMVPWLRENRYESVTLPISPGFTIVRVDGQAGPWVA